MICAGLATTAAAEDKTPAPGGPLADALETASIPTGEDATAFQSQLPQIVGKADAALYRRIFELQRRGQWPQADRLIAKLDDKLLLGHVLFQRYMHPTKYRSRYVELKDWMKAYADHPGARRVYKLALRRKPRGWRAPRRPVGVTLGPIKAGPVEGDAESAAVAVKKRKTRRLSRARRRDIRYIRQRVKSLVRRGRPTQALKILNQPNHKRRFDAVRFDRTLAIVARGYYHAGKNRKALSVAMPAVRRSGAAAPMALWWSGLAAWRSGYHTLAADHFEMLARSDPKDSWIASAAAYWAARGNLVGRRPGKVNPMLAIAARHPRTFYGLLAARALDETPSFDWELPKLGHGELALLGRVPGAKRALALVQVGEAPRAESELKRFTGHMSPELARILLGLTAKASLPALAYRLGKQLGRKGGYRYDAALYPVPDWIPANGFTVDRAIIFALIRRESGFKTRAKSRAGARGLMQLMPRTAGFIARKRFRGSGRYRLFDPVYNIELGQKYVRHLMRFGDIDGNLFYAIAAYNGGPGNLGKWRRKIDYGDDPLLFIESIPSRETRHFVERVLTNFWIYRYRLGQPTPSLDAVAAGTWPRYNGLDPRNRKVTKRGN